jgi:hypothetical protein
MRQYTAVALLFSVVLMLVGCQQVSVRGPGGKEMTLAMPKSLTIAQGQKAIMTVDIDRKMFASPVTVSISGLPSGVSVDRSSQTVETDAATFILKADREATLVVNQDVEIKAEGPDNMVARDYVRLTVKRM